ncbi:hypothetical protein AMTR_s00040p00138780 [Amborella trichopoda]|uniref:Uncharacterized protein n=1 Tax=Amborella trichopoda TaxID=13333 RepID=W1PYC1_AMBTC|nr:hypothetical protein AMTR_s00040p00138780 [Amborella trichopoda]
MTWSGPAKYTIALPREVLADAVVVHYTGPPGMGRVGMKAAAARRNLGLALRPDAEIYLRLPLRFVRTK